jgi:hypothetical protein
MWETYRQIAFKYPRILLEEERQLIAQAKGNSKAKAEEIVLRHVGFVIRRIHKKAFPSYLARYGGGHSFRTIFILYDKIKTYDLEYKDRQGNLKPVRFSSYIWKRIDGFIIDSLKKETKRQQSHESPDWERYKPETIASNSV